MRTYLIILFLTCICNLAEAQVNYVLNPGLEQYSKCPTGPDQIRYANYWSQIDTNVIDPLCSPEYCNTCAIGTEIGVPQTGYYYHFPRTGNGMAQMEMYFDKGYPSQLYERDYLQGRLSQSLTGGRSYCVTFYVTLTQASKYAINHIGAYLDDGSIDVGQDSASCAAPQTAYTPQILETSVINDTLNWVKIQGNFTANGAEKYITIGNFFDIAHTATVPLAYSGDNFSWYLIDDVSVIESTEVANAGPDVLISIGDSVHIGTSEEGMPCTWYILDSAKPIGYSGGIWVKPDSTTSYVVEMDLCGNVTYDTMVARVAPVGVKTICNPALAAKILPNPAKNELTIQNAANSTLTIYNLLGQQTYQSAIATNKELLNISILSPGTYILRITTPGGTVQNLRLLKE